MSKKILSLCLCMVIIFGTLTACHAESKQQVPKTITIGNTVFTGTYDSKSKTLLYQANKSLDESWESEGNATGISSVSSFIAMALTNESTDSKLNQDYSSICLNKSDQMISDIDTSYFVSDLIRSGKIEHIRIRFIDLYGTDDQFTDGADYDFTINSNHLTRSHGFIHEADGYTYLYHYNSTGDLIGLEFRECEIEIRQKDNKIISIIEDPNTSYASHTIPVYNSNDQISKVGNTLFTYNEKGQLIKTQGSEVSMIREYGSDNTLNKITYIDHTEQGRKTPVTFTYMNI